MLRKEFKKNKYTLELVKEHLFNNKEEKRGVVGVGLYKQLNSKGECLYHEVIKVRKNLDMNPFTGKIPEYKYPSNEDWGLFGWSYDNYENALSKFNEIKEGK